MHYLESSCIVAILASLGLGLFVWFREPHARMSRVYLLWTSSIALWNLCTFILMRKNLDVGSAKFWASVLQVGVIALPPLNFHLSFLIARIEKFFWVKLSYGIFGSILVFSLVDFWLGSNLFLKGVQVIEFNDEIKCFYGVAGPAYYVFIVEYSASILASFFLLQKKAAQSPLLYRRQIYGFLWAMSILAVFGTHDLLPLIEIRQYPLSDRMIFPLGNMAAILYSFIVGYCVMHHQLLDVHYHLSHYGAQIIRLLFLLPIGGAFFFLVALLTKQGSTIHFGGAMLVLFLTLLTASFLFPRLFGAGNDWIERQLMGDRFEYHDKIHAFIRSIPDRHDVQELFNELHELLVNVIEIDRYAVLAQDDLTHAYVTWRAYPESRNGQVNRIKTKSPLLEMFKKQTRSFIALNAANQSAGSHQVFVNEVRELLKPFQPEFCFPFIYKEKILGFFLIGPKKSKDPYTPHDILLMEQMVKQLGIVMNLIQLNKRVLMAEEMELIGRMSGGMAHDLRNLLTPISTLLQLLTYEDVNPDQFNELLPMALRNTETMQSYIRESLFFSQNNTANFQDHRLSEILLKAVRSVDNKANRKGVMIQLQEPTPRGDAELDAILIQRMVSNLLTNAIDASPQGGLIKVNLEPILGALEGANSLTDGWTITVIDHGVGISANNLKKITDPYFTTKDHGDENRGFGLGLSICQRIVQIHRGRMSISSEENIGTQVRVDIPMRQAKKKSPVMIEEVKA